MAVKKVSTTSNVTTLGKDEWHVSNGGVLIGGTVNNGSGKLYVSSGGTAKNTIVAVDDARVYVLNGGKLVNTLIKADQTHVEISSGGAADTTTITNYGSMFVFSAGTADGVTANNYGRLKVSAGGVARNVTLNNYGYAEVFGGKVYDAVINSAGHLNISGGGSFDAKVNSAGELRVISGSAMNTEVRSGGSLTLRGAEAVASSTVVSGGIMRISSGVAEATTVADGGKMYVSAKGIAKNTTVLTGGTAIVNGGVASNGTVAGTLNVSKGLAQGFQLDDDGTLNVLSGGTAKNVTVSGDGSIMVLASGAISNVNVAAGGKVNGFTMSSQTTLNKVNLSNATVDDDAVLYAGQKAANTTVTDDMVSLYGEMSNTVLSGGTLKLFNGGKHTGELDIADDALVIAESGSVIDFNISTREVDSDDAIISGWERISGAPTFTITVDNEQAFGNYILIDDVGSFNKSISINAGGKVFGNLMIGGIKSHNGDHAFSLSIVDDDLVLNVAYEDRTPPVKPVAKASTTAATNKSVTVTATFSEDSFIKEVSLDNKTWTDYNGGIVMTKNGTVYFRAMDDSGNISEVTAYTVKNIDLVPPAKPVAKPNTTAIVKGSVTVSATFSSDSKVKQYSLDNKTWNTYSSGIVMKKNGMVYFRAADAAGNYSATTSYKVTNVYTPVAKVVTGLKGKVSKYNVTYSWNKYATAKGDKVTYKVKIDDGKVTTVTSNKLTLKNVAIGKYTISVQTVVTAPNMTVSSSWSDVVSVTVKDVTKPTLSKVTGTVNGYSATIKMTASDNVKVTKYVVTYGKTSRTITSNSLTLKDLAVGKVSVSVIAYDAAGNKSSTKKVSLNIKDITPPSKVSTLYAPSVTNKYKGTFTWKAATDNSGKIARYEIQLDNGKIYKSAKTTLSVSGLSVGEHTYRVRAIDKDKNVGAWSDAKSFTVKDMTAPSTVSVSAKISGNDATLTWKKPKDNVGVTKYVLKYGAKLEKSVTLSGSATKYVIAGLAKGTYQYSMVAYDAAGNASKVKTGKLTIKQELTPAAAAAALGEVDFGSDAGAIFAPQEDILSYCSELNGQNVIASVDDLTTEKKEERTLLASV